MRALFVIVAIVSAGCSYPEFHFTQSGDTEPPETSAIDSTATDTFAPPPADSSNDSSVVDTFLVDTRADTKPDVAPDVPPPTVCATTAAKFCVDWDTSTLPEDGFNYPNISPTGSVAIDTTGGRSVPNAFVATTMPSTEPVVMANLSKIITTAANDTLIKLDAWIKLETDKFPTTMGGSAFLLKIQRNAGEGDGVTFSIDQNGFIVDRIGLTYEAYGIATTTYKPKIGTWMHVRVHTKIHTTAGALTVWIDNMSTPVLSRTAISTARMDSTAKQAIIGLYSESASATFRARYDDVEVDY